MSFIWKRPENVQFPSVWLRFKAKDLNSENLVEYIMQDLPTDRYEDAINHMCIHFLVDEPMCKSLGKNIKKKFHSNFKHISLKD